MSTRKRRSGRAVDLSAAERRERSVRLHGCETYFRSTAKEPFVTIYNAHVNRCTHTVLSRFARFMKRLSRYNKEPLSGIMHAARDTKPSLCDGGRGKARSEEEAKARILVHPLLGPINVNGLANQRCLRTIIEERLCRIVN